MRGDRSRRRSRLLGDAAADGAALVVLPERLRVDCIRPARGPRRPRRGPTAATSCWERMWASGASTCRATSASARGRARRGVRQPRGPPRHRRERTRGRSPGLAVQHAVGHRSRGRRCSGTASSCRPCTNACFYGVGAGDDLDVVALPGVGRVGGLICWENRMPLARWAVYEGGPQIWLAPSSDDSDGWIASMRHIAMEAGFVVSVPQYIPASVPVRLSPPAARRARRSSARRRLHRVARRATVVRRAAVYDAESGGDRRLRPSDDVLHAKRELRRGRPLRTPAVLARQPGRRPN